MSAPTLPPIPPLRAPGPVVTALMRRRDAVSKSAAELILELARRAGADLSEEILGKPQQG